MLVCVCACASKSALSAPVAHALRYLFFKENNTNRTRKQDTTASSAAETESLASKDTTPGEAKPSAAPAQPSSGEPSVSQPASSRGRRKEAKSTETPPEYATREAAHAAATKGAFGLGCGEYVISGNRKVWA